MNDTSDRRLLDDYDRQREEARERLREKSISGKSAKRTKEKRVSMKMSDYIRSIKIIAIASAATAVLAVSTGSYAVDEVRDAMVISSLSKEFQREIVAPETHRTDDHKNYFYDYGDLARKLNEYGDFDEAVYLLDSCIGDYQTGLVLEHTDYGSFTHYKEVKGYKSTDEFQDDMKDRILLQKEIESKEKELQNMVSEHSDKATYQTNHDKGGK